MLSQARQIKIVPDLPSLQRAGADEFVRCARESINSHGRFCVALSGGNTPRGMNVLLASEPDIPWHKVHIFFGDERHVPPADPQSNFGMTRDTLLSAITIPAGNIHRVRAELDAETAAKTYEDELRQFFPQTTNGWPRFDLILLGMGPEGHTASLFPGSPAIREKTRWVVANCVEKLKTERITFTFPVLNHAAEVLFIVTGEDKAEVVKQILEGPSSPPEPFPAQQVRPVDGKLLWMVDETSGRLLKAPRS